jgi:hypothetical protein
MDKIESFGTHSRTYDEIAVERVKILTDILQVIKQDPSLYVHLSWRLPCLRSDCAVYSHVCAASTHMLSTQDYKKTPYGWYCKDNNTYKPVYQLLSEVLENNY